jgi:hypothetical protein
VHSDSDHARIIVALVGSTTKSEQHLELISELSSVAGAVCVALWLRGGWAMDFFIGRVSRDHEDIDAFIWASEADRLVEREQDRWDIALLEAATGRRSGPS